MKYEFFIGRYQPLHAGHIALIRTVLDEGKNVCIGLRDIPTDEFNPYSIEDRIAMFNAAFAPELLSGRMKLVVLPDIANVCYGRDVGWGIREIRLDSETESISATALRALETLVT